MQDKNNFCRLIWFYNVMYIKMYLKRSLLDGAKFSVLENVILQGIEVTV